MKHLALFLGFGVLVGCGTTREAWVQQNCTQDGGYKIGVNDARAGRSLAHSALQKCPADKMEVTRKGYDQGFKAAGGKENADEYGQDVFRDVTHMLDDESKPAEKHQDKKSQEKKSE